MKREDIVDQDLQFYRTPPALAHRLWRLFKDRDFELVLDACAGDGALAKARPDGRGYGRECRLHCIEIDVRHHEVLRAEGFDVVALDFLDYCGGAMYSHIVMNPPFSQGVRHVLRAWDLLWDGEIAAIINAETVRNPCTREREQLVRLIEKHGRVEFVRDAFMDVDATRKTEVEVALVHLVKTADTEADIVGELLGRLRSDEGFGQQGDDFEEAQQLALRGNEIANLARAFDAAAVAMRESVLARARAAYFAGLLGQTMARRNGDLDGAPEALGKAGSAQKDYVCKTLNAEYAELKDRAWASVLRSAEVLSKLSSAGQKSVEAQFATIKKLEFTEANVRGFLVGLCENQGQIQLEMACAVFDEITTYHTENTVYYKGWKSNDVHRSCGWRIRTTRFVLPYFRHHSWGLDHGCIQKLADFDKVFAMLDGKREPEVPLAQLCERQFGSLKTSERMTSSYFDVRYYKGVGTMHFFARRKDLVDRLNRIVGRHREWLPPERAKVDDGFWLQYEQAEKLDKEIREEVARGRSRYADDPLRQLRWSSEDEERERALRTIGAALDGVHQRHGIQWGDRIEFDADAPMLTDQRMEKA
jgi:predicted RNA methylase